MNSLELELMINPVPVLRQQAGILCLKNINSLKGTGTTEYNGIKVDRQDKGKFGSRVYQHNLFFNSIWALKNWEKIYYEWAVFCFSFCFCFQLFNLFFLLASCLGHLEIICLYSMYSILIPQINCIHCLIVDVLPQIFGRSLMVVLLFLNKK